MTDPLEDPPDAAVVGVAPDELAVVGVAPDELAVVVGEDDEDLDEPQAARARAPATRTIGTVRFKTRPSWDIGTDRDARQHGASNHVRSSDDVTNRRDAS